MIWVAVSVILVIVIGGAVIFARGEVAAIRESEEDYMVL